ncbi:MAG: methyltransferase domain-containing protein [Geminicoccaceae bacterium]|nr:methyltransferase domain-containing protein [Geminicoccaceae bacterium]MCB9942408.1 methyltransferase domain-containing protein [Geminicoccaceae bacterium]
MRPDISQLISFYDSLLGETTRRLINVELRQLWPDVTGRAMLGLGFPGPYLAPFDEAERRLALMPATQGVTRWPMHGINAAALGREDELPFADCSFECVLMTHALECSPHPNRLMREVWRILADGGRLIVVVPNRSGLWCWSEQTPFGYGQPFTKGQLERTLRNHLFSIGGQRTALIMPPFRRSLARRLTIPVERIGVRYLPQLAGVLIIDAQKQIYAGTARVAALRPSSRRYLPVIENPVACYRQD